MLKKSMIVVGVLLVLAAILVACAPATPAPTEAPVVPTVAEATAVPPTAVPTEVPPTVAPTADPADAIKPIFEASGHADAKAEAFVHWDADEAKVVPTTCAKCHSEAGFVEYITNGKIAAGIPVPGKPFSCTMCHNEVADKLTSVTFPSGVVVENLGPEARCMTCHQGRESKISLDAKLAQFGENLDPDAVPAPLPAKDANSKPTPLGFTNVHYFAAGGTLYAGQVHMGYEYEGKIYDVKTQHVDGFNTCIGCHDQHSLQVKVESCAECHEGVKAVEDLQAIREPSSAKDYDGDGDVTEGVAMEVKGLQEVLYAAIQAYGKEVAGAEINYDAVTYPYFMGADGKSYPNWTPRLLKAAYNYQVSVKDPGAFAHGGKYIIELLYDSIEDLNASEKLTTKTVMDTLAREDAGHFNGAQEAWRHWDKNADGAYTYEVESGCVKCHSAGGLPAFLAGKEATSMPAGNGLMCSTCHDVTAFPALIAIKDVTLPSGKVVTFGENAASNTCLECHQARAAKKSVDKKISDFNVTDMDVIVPKTTIDGKEQAFSFINAHYLGIAGIYFGTDAQIAYEYDGKTYVGVNTHVPADMKTPGCVGCHNPHSGEWDTAKCATCHAGITSVDDIRGASNTTDWNGNGDVAEPMRMEVRALRDAMLPAIQAYAKDKAGVGIVYDPNAYPYWFADADGDGKADLKDGKAVTFTSWTGRLLKAAYNYNFLRKNPGTFVHNAKYALQIEFDTIEDIGGDVSKFTRP